MNPFEKLFQLVKDILANPTLSRFFSDDNTSIRGDFLIWLFIEEEEEENEDYYYFAVNPYGKKVFELTSPDQDPFTGIPVTDPELVIVILQQMAIHLEGCQLMTEYAKIKKEARTIFPGIILGTFHSLN